MTMKWPEDFVNKVICGDCLEVMKGIPAESIDLLLTDPPYGIHLDTSWLTALNVKRGKPANKSDSKIHGDDGSIDLSILRTFPRRIVFGFPYLSDPNMTGWLVWDKQPGLERDHTLGTPVEMAYSTVWRGFRIKRCLWSGYYRGSKEGRYQHPTQKPLKIIRPLVREFSNLNDIILDPFAGSGTTLVAAKELGRCYIGIEIDPKYCAIAEQRLAQQELLTAEVMR